MNTHTFCQSLAHDYSAYGFPEPDFTFAHITLSDGNLDNSSIDFCLEAKAAWLTEQRAERVVTDHAALDRYAQEIVEYLLWLKTLPMEARERLYDEYEE